MNQPADNSLAPYPRPQLVRTGWAQLDGTWDYACEDAPVWNCPAEVNWQSKITVPFAPETAASGIGDTSFHQVFWYRRIFEPMQLNETDQLILHFGAVDYSATVWVNDHAVVHHEGGYTPFQADITNCLNDGDNFIYVRAEDDPHDLAKPRGKQDWQLEPHAIWYPRTSGIWQTVWMEVVPPISINSLVWLPNLQRWEIGMEATIAGKPSEQLRIEVTLRTGDKLLASDSYTVIGTEVTRRIALPDPGIDDYRNELLWSPNKPTLIEAELRLFQADKLIDEISSYTALRSVAIQKDQFLLNGRPLFLNMVLDQGYWPDSGLTAPNDEALKHDIELTKAMGFNGVRKHQKIESPRYLYWADRLGLLVWEEMPSCYRFTKTSTTRTTREWLDVLKRDLSHPCIVAWVPFNESWGVPDLPNVSEHRHCVQSLYHLTKSLDPDRPVIGNDGWESVATDIVTIHDYDNNLKRLHKRYDFLGCVPEMLKQTLPAGRLITVVEESGNSRPIMLTEFGGLSISNEPESWGYSRLKDASELRLTFTNLLAAVRSMPVFSGLCYTQFADTYQETNGLLHSDRTPKFDLAEVSRATSGPLE